MRDGVTGCKGWIDFHKRSPSTSAAIYMVGASIAANNLWVLVLRRLCVKMTLDCLRMIGAAEKSTQLVRPLIGQFDLSRHLRMTRLLDLTPVILIAALRAGSRVSLSLARCLEGPTCSSRLLVFDTKYHLHPYVRSWRSRLCLLAVQYWQSLLLTNEFSTFRDSS